VTRREHHHLRWRRRNEQQACEGLEMVCKWKEQWKREKAHCNCSGWRGYKKFKT